MRCAPRHYSRSLSRHNFKAFPHTIRVNCLWEITRCFLKKPFQFRFFSQALVRGFAEFQLRGFGQMNVVKCYTRNCIKGYKYRGLLCGCYTYRKHQLQINFKGENINKDNWMVLTSDFDGCSKKKWNSGLQPHLVWSKSHDLSYILMVFCKFESKYRKFTRKLWYISNLSLNWLVELSSWQFWQL